MTTIIELDQDQLAVDDDPVVAMAANLFLGICRWRAAGRVGIPVLIPSDAPPVTAGSCISCGIAISTGWRCPACRVAVGIAFTALDLAGVDQQEIGPG